MYSNLVDEDAQVPVRCAFKCPRLDPKVERLEWHSDEPTEEAKKAMELHEKTARGEIMEETEESNDIIAKAKKLTFDLDSNQGKVKAAEAFVDLFSGEYELDIDQSRAKQFFGMYINSNIEDTPAEIVQKLIQEKGFRAKKEEKQEKKKDAAKSTCNEPKNAEILEAFQELLSIYSKGKCGACDISKLRLISFFWLSSFHFCFSEKNNNAAASYAKVVKAISALDYPITAENAMGLSKGKTKVEGIGKGSAEKMKEFCLTGKITKLEEKRAAMTD